MSQTVYKICTDEEWAEALVGGRYRGSSDDVRDGFIHLSTADQLAGTLEKHFCGVEDLVLIALSADQLGPALKWEPSRNNELFPHLYGELQVDAALSVAPLPLGDDGIAIVPPLDDVDGGPTSA